MEQGEADQAEGDAEGLRRDSFQLRDLPAMGTIRYQRHKQTIAVDDAWIAATARACDSPLVTHNPKDFRDIEGLEVLTEG